MYNEKLYDDLIEGFNQKVKSDVFLKHRGFNSFKELAIINFEMSLENIQQRKRVGRYYVDTKEKTFLHFTSLEALMSIVNERSLRMYNLLGVNDQEEYKYSAEGFNKYLRHDVDWVKEHSFSLSLTDHENLESEHFWNSEYSSNGKGVAIELSFQNEQKDWEAFDISPVYYEKNPDTRVWLEELDKISKVKEVLGVQFDPSTVFGFHKVDSGKWNNEKEVRLYTAFPLSGRKEFKDRHEWICYDPYSFDRSVQYLPLPLYVSPDLDETLKDVCANPRIPGFPVPKIEAVHFKSDNLKIWDYKDQIKAYISKRLGYWIDLEPVYFDRS
ncbi:MAG TPA: hypothetical protein DCG19_12130 [Cryomorphaceae bacterium]|nr:hypothetical protein [Owenweeksia sp.]MBF97628.1 hypothetical protein [Owenweeksia sp.]HAD98148.1 hypothetical protein [Cryomorphaceae bacterium]HBF20603.1 hypothetical protein [Cryomorphaceae bacterium]|tara:strand:+ start:306 stop:1286 length:981 start_codon:yes stop_codon:yes gene_type:complete